MKTNKKAYRAAGHEFLEHPERWTRIYEQEDENREPCYKSGKPAIKWCAVGMIKKHGGSVHSDSSEYDSITKFNDYEVSPEATTPEEVGMALLFLAETV